MSKEVIDDKNKDWQVAQLMFGKNKKEECKIVKNLRKRGIVESLCEGWSIIRDSRLLDDCGWIIPNEALKTKEDE